MFNKRFFLLGIACTLAVSTTSVFASDQTKPAGSNSGETAIAQEVPDNFKAKMANIVDQISDEQLAKIAEKLGIDMTGLTRDQILDQIKAKAKEKITTAMDQITDEQLAQFAQKVGIDTTGLTREQIIQKLKEKKMSIINSMTQSFKGI